MQLSPEQLEAMKFKPAVSPSEKRRLAAESNRTTRGFRRGGGAKQAARASWATNTTNVQGQRRPAEYVGSSRSSGKAAPTQDSSTMAKADGEAVLSSSTNLEEDVTFNYEETTLDHDTVYQQFRARALKVRRQRDRLREQAHAHYLNGDDKSRREKLNIARGLNDEIGQLNESAASHIFSFKNRPESGMGEFKMDLHGLHATEATRFLEERISTLSLQMADIFDVKQRKDLLVVVGKGNHQRGLIMLQPAIQEFLTSAQVRFNWKPEEGTFHITIPRVFNGT